MAGGGFSIDAPSNGFDGKITLSVIITCIVAASSGLIFGYDVGISGFFSSSFYPVDLYLPTNCLLFIFFEILIIFSVCFNFIIKYQISKSILLSKLTRKILYDN
jgi:hypothetical protein